MLASRPGSPSAASSQPCGGATAAYVVTISALNVYVEKIGVVRQGDQFLKKLSC